MQPCSVEIEYYRPDRIFRTGESVQGWVRVTAHRNITCRGLHINGLWKTTGMGNTTQKNFAQQTLYQGTWTQGHKYEYPFEVFPPVEPLSYEGKLLNIEHNVSARADVTWAQPPKAVSSFYWRIGTQVASIGSDNSAAEHKPMPWRALLAIILVCFCLLLIAKYSWWFAILLLLPLYVSGFSFGSFFADRLVHSVDWSVPATCSPGDAVETQLKFRTLGNIRPQKVSLVLQGRESVAIGDEEQRRAYRHTLHREAASTTKMATDGNEFQTVASLEVPQTEAYSLRLLGNQITWTLKLYINLPFGLRHSQRRQILVQPKALASLTTRDGDSNPNPAFETRTFFDLLKLTRQLTQTSQDRPLNTNFDEPYAVVLDVKKTLATSKDWQDAEFAGGTTLIGCLPGSTLPIQVLLPKNDSPNNNDILKNEPIEQWTGTAVVADFCVEQKTIVLLAV